MQITLDPIHGKFYIKSYTPGQIQINEQVFQHSVILSPTELIENWPPQTSAELSVEHLETILALKPTVVILGTGSKLQFPKENILDVFTKLHIGIEVMDTNAACRTYNVLMSEARNVVAGLLIR